MRLMHVYLGCSYGGIEQLLITTLRLRALWPTIEPAFVIYPPGDFIRELEAAGAVVHDLGVGNVRLRNPLSLWRARRRLRELLAAKRSDLVVVHNLWLWAMFGAGARASGLPTMLWLHDPPMHPTDWVTRWARLTRPDQVLCDSDYTAGLAPRLFPGVPVEAVHCPVEPALADKLSVASLREAARTELGLDKDAVVIIQACRPSELKGNLELVRALAELRDLPNWVCLQVGRPVLSVDVEYLARVKQAADELGIAERVRFLGYQSDLARLLAASDIHCQPNTLREPFGIAFIEALYAGLPVVTTAMAGPLEIVDESCGILVTPGDVDALAVALGRLIRDPGLRRRLGAQGPVRARELCDPAAQMAKLEAVLLKAGSRAIGGATAGEATA
jgi:glycosyltransferase involved in cell wall biosynthesis